MRNFVGDTIAAFQQAGAQLYNSAIMMFPLHTLPMRVSGQFGATAKLGMAHQHVLVFYNGRQPAKEIKSIGLPENRTMEWL